MIELMLLIIALILFMLPFALIGLFLFIQIAKGKKLPMDESNRINHIRLVWFSLTRPELFVHTFAWLKRDELDNVKDKK